MPPNLLKMKKNKAQIQMTENVIIIIIIIFILAFVFRFYSQIREGTLEQKGREYTEIDLVKSSQIISSSPEFSCSRSSLIDLLCFDTLKLEAFVNLNLSQDYYAYYTEKFGKSKITIKEIYPQKDINFTIYNNNYTGEFISEKKVMIPINTYDPLNDTFNFAYIEITRYIK